MPATNLGSYIAWSEEALSVFLDTYQEVFVVLEWLFVLVGVQAFLRRDKSAVDEPAQDISGDRAEYEPSIYYLVRQSIAMSHIKSTQYFSSGVFPSYLPSKADQYLSIKLSLCRF